MGRCVFTVCVCVCVCDEVINQSSLLLTAGGVGGGDITPLSIFTVCVKHTVRHRHSDRRLQATETRGKMEDKSPVFLFMA